MMRKIDEANLFPRSKDGIRCGDEEKAAVDDQGADGDRIIYGKDDTRGWPDD